MNPVLWIKPVLVLFSVLVMAVSFGVDPVPIPPAKSDEQLKAPDQPKAPQQTDLVAKLNGTDKPVPMHSFAEVNVKIDLGDQVRWKIIPTPIKVVDDLRGNLYVAAKPGSKFTIMATVFNFDTKKFSQGETVLSFSDQEDGGGGGGDDVIPPKKEELTGFAQELTIAFKYETDEDKTFAPSYSQMYDSAATRFVDQSTTWGDLFNAMSKDVADRKISGKLPATQRAIQKYLKANLPSMGASDTPISSEGKVNAKKVFAAVSSALAKLK